MGETQLKHFRREGETQNACGLDGGIAIEEIPNLALINPSEITCPECQKKCVVEITPEQANQLWPAALDNLIRQSPKR
jgi:hypothetical protein